MTFIKYLFAWLSYYLFSAFYKIGCFETNAQAKARRRLKRESKKQ